MADTTAWIMVGPQSGAFGSDHFDPTHLLVLMENDRASWTLRPIGQPPVRAITWIPFSPDTFVHDAMLMMAVHVFQDEQFLETASRVIPGLGEERLDLNAFARSSELARFYEQCRSLTWKCSMVVTVLPQSSLGGLLDHFAQYPFDVRICRDGDSASVVSRRGLALPPDTTLPFFTYGLFKPRELPYRQIQAFVDGRPVRATVEGSLVIRDGLPLLKPGGGGRVGGT